MAEAGELSMETFLKMAALQGVDTSDPDHTAELYASVKDIMATVAELRRLDLGDNGAGQRLLPGGGLGHGRDGTLLSKRGGAWTTHRREEGLAG